MVDVFLERQFYEALERLNKTLERIADTLDYIEKTLEAEAEIHARR